MSSNVFFKFTSQREPSRVTFDGTSISVWELKRDIITQSGLGDGTDFDLIITNPDTNEEYTDDTTQISRSTSVTAKRARPAQGPSRGRAARYLTGKMPTNARSGLKVDQSTSSGPQASTGTGTEDENIAALFKETGAQWEQEKARMAEATRVSRPGGPPRPDQNNQRGPPPVGYVCHRCRKPGHFIQNCPTNNDANYDNGPRVKRTTGIPRSFLRTVKEDEDSAPDGLTSEKKVPSNIMVNAEGQRVEAIPDIASWEQYRAKAEASAASKNESSADSKELEERGLACPIDKRLFVDPQKTPCCGHTYCHDCIEAALANSDLICPHCGEQALFDQLQTDDEMVNRIKEYHEEKASKAKATEGNDPSKSHQDSSSDRTKSTTPPRTASNPKKRRAEQELPNDRQKTKSPPGSKPQSPKLQVKDSLSSPKPKSATPVVNNSNPAPTGPRSDQDLDKQMNELAKQYGFINGMTGMQMPNGFNPYAMPNMPGMNGMPNPAMMQMMQTGMNPFAMGMMGMSNMMNGNNGGMNFDQNNGGMAASGGWNNNLNNNNLDPGIPTGPKAQRTTAFPYQQASRGNDDDAYMRKPLNPHRAAQKVRRARPMDFKEL